MTTTKLLKSLLITVLLSSVTAHAASQTIVIALEEGKQIASFRLQASNCPGSTYSFCAPSGPAGFETGWTCS